MFGVKYLIARPFNVYGEGELPGEYVGYAHVIPDLIGKVLGGQYRLEILGSGNQTRCYTYVDDVVDGMLFIAERTENDDSNIGINAETTVTELAERIWRLCKRKESLKSKHMSSFFSCNKLQMRQKLECGGLALYCRLKLSSSKVSRIGELGINCESPSVTEDLDIR
jgi:nucleoside-diphosphate-sugar epimerase